MTAGLLRRAKDGRWIIAMDGPAGVGKSTVGQLVAKKLGYHFINTGEMYRALTWRALEDGVDLKDGKALTELSRGLASYRERSRGEQPRNLYLLEEPTIGLHLSDCEKLIRVLHSLVEQGHTVVVIEHHLDLLAEADYLVELGPVGGPDGGELLYQGELSGLRRVPRSPTAPYLLPRLKPRAG